MKKIILLFLFSIYLVNFLFAQVIKGKVIDRETLDPIRNANVFLEGTLMGTITDEEGNFEFDSKGLINHPLIVSYIGFESRVILLNEQHSDFSIPLRKKIVEINEVTVNAKLRKKSRRKMLRKFKEEFLGFSYRAKSCKIINEEDLFLYKNIKTNALTGYSKKPLIIENKMLGYKILYLLENFQYSNSGVRYKGYSSFEELKFRNKMREKEAIEEREDCYLGSIMHFIRVLYSENNTDRDTIYDIKVIARNSREEKPSLAESNLDGGNPVIITIGNKTSFNWEGDYTNKFQLYDSLGEYLSSMEILQTKGSKKKICYNKTIKLVHLGNLRSSYMVPKTDCVEIFSNGYYNPESISWYGRMSQNRVGDLLPFDYYPTPKTN